MANLRFSTKRLQISKANARLVMVVSVAAFVTAFSLVIAQSLFVTRSFQARLISEKEKAVNQLIENKQAVSNLAGAYNEFVSRPENIIGGNPAGKGDRDGDNARIILDALPSKYDFPALTSSLEKLFSERYQLSGISGTDDEVAQKEIAASPNPEPVEIPVVISLAGNYSSMQDALLLLERSIRPFHVNSLDFNASDNDQVSLSVNMKTYYQPEKALSITKKELE